MLRTIQLSQYVMLMRLHKPIPILLLLWPTLWSLWLAGNGAPDFKIVCIFVAGVLLTRSAGCVINDLVDRKFDKHVKRTQHRPLATGKVSVSEALFLIFLLGIFSFILVLFCNLLTIKLAFLGAIIAIIYPFLKRITHLPQLGLGVAFTWGIPMAFAAQLNSVPWQAWYLFCVCALWPLIYDTQYAMADREDDLKIGVKSSAILFGAQDKSIIVLLQMIFVFLLMSIGFIFHLHSIYYFSLFIVANFFIYQQWLIRDRLPSACLSAFLNNHWIGLIIFMGIFFSCK